MHIHLSRAADWTLSAEVLREQLTRWSVLAGFAEGPAASDRWVYRRGGGWSSLWSWNVRDLYTEVTAAHLPLSQQVALSLVCASVWHVAFPADHRRLEDDFSQLIAFLVAAPGRDRDRLEEEVRLRWQGGAAVRPADRGFRETTN